MRESTVVKQRSKKDIIHSGLLFRNATSILINPLDFLSASVKDYGPVIKLHLFGKQYFLVQHPTYVKQVLVDNNKIYEKIGHKLGSIFLGNSLATSNGETWVEKRRIISPAFHRQKLEKMTDVINEETTFFIDRLANVNPVKPINITGEFRQLTLSIISRTMFNTRLAAMDGIIKITDELANYASKYMKSFVKIPIAWPTAANQHYKKNVQRFNEIIYSIIRKRKADSIDSGNANNNDLLDMLLDHRDEHTGKPLPEKTVRDEITTMLIGGHETTTQALSWTIYQLAKNRQLLLKVRAESDVLLGDQFPAYHNISKLTYTKQLLYEILRYYPPLWLLARKNIQEDHLNDFHVPAGSNILINLYGLHRHPDYWASPDIFDPDHFHSSLDENRPPFVFIPFSAAPRSCIGHNFAMLEMLIVVNRIARTFDLEISDSYVPKIEAGATLKAVGGIPLKVKRIGY